MAPVILHHKTYVTVADTGCGKEINGYRQDPNRWTKMCDVFSLGCEVYHLSTLKY